MAVYLKAYTEETGVINNVAEPFTFPGGEVDLKLNPDVGSLTGATWIADVRGADLGDLMAAAMLADVVENRLGQFVLMLPYLPAARADRGVPCGKWVYSKLIDSFDTDQIITIDEHSTKGEGWYANRTTLSALPLLDRALESQGHWRYDGIIAPDKGAKDRANEVAQKYGLDLYVADKVRDFETGKILDYKIDIPKSGNYLVVDDICDGGWTFTELARVSGLDKSNLDLWVTHGVFSGDADQLKHHYGHILTTDSHPGHNRVGVATTIVPTFTYMYETMIKGL